MLVSVITSVYNEEKYISEMLDSLIAQTYKEWELIIIDDASSDDTWNVIKSYDDRRIIAISNEENKGLTINLNTCIQKARGEYILRIDGDDVAYPRRIEKQVGYMNAHPHIALSGCWMKSFGEKEELYTGWTDSEFMKIALLCNPVIFHPTFIIRKSVIDENQLHYNEDIRYAQDFAFQYAISKYGELGNLDEVLMKYRIHSNQISYAKNKQQFNNANMTRRCQLEDLGVNLSQNDFKLWCEFASKSIAHINDKDAEKLLDIAEQIAKQNLKRKRFATYVGEHLKRNIERYIEKSNFIRDNKEQEKLNDARLKYLSAHWLSVLNSDAIEDFIEREQIRTIAIYGMGPLGNGLLMCLKNRNIIVSYGIDQNYRGLSQEEVRIYSPQDILAPVDLIIITAIEQYKEIQTLLKQKVNCKIVSLEDFIYSC